jgi:hypothetical protein
MMRTPADNAAWVARCQATTEQLKAKEAAVKAGTSTLEGDEAGDTTQEPGRVEAARALPGSMGL